MIVNKISISAENLHIPEEFSEESGTLFFDIETTGLYWKRSHLYLIGAAYRRGDAFLLTQYLAERPGEEEALLREFSALSASFSRLCHYNGDSFDLPYLSHKFTFYGMENPLSALAGTDLYRRIRRLGKLLNFSQMKQKDVEVFLGFLRKDPFSGGELIEVYQEYLRTADECLLQSLLLHNAEDLEGMLRILPMTNYLRLFEGDAQLSSAKEVGGALRLSFSCAPLPRPLSLEAGPYALTAEEDTGVLCVSLFEGVRKLFYPNYKDYFYLPLEDRAIHKSVGIFVDKEHRERARAANCYQNVTGVFLPQPGPVLSPSLVPEYQSKEYCTPFSGELVADAEAMGRYLPAVLRFLGTGGN